MPYREPGVYSELINNRPNTGFLPSLVPLIIGEGPAFFDFKGKAITRDSGSTSDTLPSSNVTAISRIYTISDGTETDIDTNEYSLVTPNQIDWSAAVNPPTDGSTYYVDYEARPEQEQYEPAFITSYDELDTAYIGQFMKTVSGGDINAINPVYLGAYIALEAGAPGVYVLQVEPADKDTYNVVISTDIVSTLEKAEFIDDAYFLVPMTDDSTATGAVITHCNTMSGIEERKERVCFISTGIADPATSGIFTTAELDAAITECSAIKNKRVRTPFVTKASKILSDGNTYDLGAEYVCAALAGLSALIPVQRALTRQRLYNFVELKHVTKLSRANKNKLAAAGFIVLEQPGGPGSAIVIRHGITTKVDNVADREHSVVVISDFSAKYFRTSLEGYIGIYNINEFLKTKVNATLNGCKNTLVRKRILNDMEIINILQDEVNPDTLLVDLSINPPYPCNYIDLQILVD